MPNDKRKPDLAERVARKLVRPGTFATVVIVGWRVAPENRGDALDDDGFIKQVRGDLAAALRKAGIHAK